MSLDAPQDQQMQQDFTPVRAQAPAPLAAL